MASEVEVAAMRRALDLARTPGVPLGPNPRVGAVVLDASGGTIVESHHRGAGSAHAEADAVERAGERARGATLVVTLEPCNHTGRTPPCAKTLIAAGVGRVVYAQGDPNPVASGGADALRAAGVDVEAGLLVYEAAAVNQVWTFAMERRRPFVTWKFATTLDGRSAAADGSARWITGPEARADVHRQRALCDTILVGTGTAIFDNPRLNVRGADGHPLPRPLQPLRAVMGMRDVRPSAAVFDDTAATIVLRTHDPHKALDQLFQQDRQHVWLEGGPTLAGAFMRAGLVDEVIAYVAPVLLGAGRNAVADLGIETIDNAVRLELVEAVRMGNDVRLIMKGLTGVHRHR